VLPGAALGEVPEMPLTEAAELQGMRQVWLNALSMATKRGRREERTTRQKRQQQGGE